MLIRISQSPKERLQIASFVQQTVQKPKTRLRRYSCIITIVNFLSTNRFAAALSSCVLSDPAPLLSEDRPLKDNISAGINSVVFVRRPRRQVTRQKQSAVV